MPSDKKLILNFWLTRIGFLFVIIGLLYAVYLVTYVNPDTMQSYSIITITLLISISFFFDFPAYRIDFRFNELKKKFNESTDFDDNLPLGISIKNGYRNSIKSKIILTLLLLFMAFNFVLGWITYSNGKNTKLFMHMVIIIASFLLFRSSLLMYKIDIAFRDIDRFISLLNKELNTEEKNE